MYRYVRCCGAAACVAVFVMRPSFFTQMFDHGLYDRMRRTYQADGTFPRIYEKTRPEMDVWKWLAEEERHIQQQQPQQQQ